MCLSVSRIFTNASINIEKILIPVGCQTSKMVFFPSLYIDAVLSMRTWVYKHIFAVRCTHTCGTEKVVCVKLQFYLRRCQLLESGLTGVKLAAFWGLEPTVLAHHINLFLSTSLEDTEEVCLAACSTPLFHYLTDLWGFVPPFFLCFPPLSLVSLKACGERSWMSAPRLLSHKDSHHVAVKEGLGLPDASRRSWFLGLNISFQLQLYIPRQPQRFRNMWPPQKTLKWERKPSHTAEAPNDTFF